MTLRKFAGLGALLSIVMPGLAMAADEVAAPVLNSGDTAWMLTSTALVLFMTIPGLALFYGGMVRSKNILSVMMQCFAITGLITILWFVYGYSMAFDTTGMEAGVVNFNSFVGGLSKLFLSGVTPASITGPAALFPEAVFVTYQMTFAIITPALIVGAFAERMKFSAMLIFMGVWFTLVYAPIAHMVWGGPGSLLGDWGVLDFAGGTVVHINAGVAGLVACLVLGKRKGFPTTPMAPHNLGYTLVGAAMLWVGWFGFNAGSAAAANGTAALAMVNTFTATAGAVVAWCAIEKALRGKASMLGAASGIITGLVAVTPAAGFVGPVGAIVLGAVASAAAYWFVAVVKIKLGYDDSLDVFGIHGVAGIVGAIGTGIFAAPALGGVGYPEGVSMAGQVWTQFLAVAITVVWCGVVSAILYKIVDVVIGLRPSAEAEAQGLDLASHGEAAYHS